MATTTRRLDAYLRVSRRLGREGESYLSPKIQRERIEQWATYKGVRIAQWHQDEDWSGGTHNRPGLEAAIARALAGETDGIVSANIDRFSRTTELGLRELRRLEAVDARLAFVMEDIDTATVYGKMIYTILLAVAEAFLANIKANWEAVKTRAVARGAYISRTPWGYERKPDGTLSPHPKRGPIVTETFRLAAGDSLHTAMTYLHRVAPERAWTTTKVRRLLSQRSYLGETRNGDLVEPDTHPALTARTVWEAAQSSPASRLPRGAFPLSGVMCCDTCGSPMIGGRGGKGQRVYRCSATLSTHRGEKCQRGTVITAANVEQYVQATLRDMLAGVAATVSHPDEDMLTLLERAVGEAEEELDAFASDMTLRRALGDRYHVHLASRADTLERARAAYREHARTAQEAIRLQAPDVAEDPELWPLVLRDIFSAVLVRPGRGLRVGDRVRFVPVNGDDPAGVSDV